MMDMHTTKNPLMERNVYDSLKGALKEVKDHKDGKKTLKPYSDYKEKWQRWAEEDDK